MNDAAVAQSVERRICNSEAVCATQTGSTLTAHQPCYFPWLGFWAKLASADQFVIFDNVPFSRHDYSNRVQIKTQHGVQWLTVPVEHGGSLLKDAKIVDDRWQRKHLRTIELAYNKAPYFDVYFPLIEKLLNVSGGTLEKLCTGTLVFGIGSLFNNLSALQIFHSLQWGSEFYFSEKKSALVLEVCKQLGATRYIFGAKGRDYADVAAFERAGIEVEFQSYKHPTYRQLHGPFVPGLSIIDLLMNEGPNSLEILRG